MPGTAGSSANSSQQEPATEPASPYLTAAKAAALIAKEIH